QLVRRAERIFLPLPTDLAARTQLQNMSSSAMQNPSATRKPWWTLLFAALVPAACTTSSQGTVAPGCSDGYSDCGGVCLDLQGDGQNCGACGTTCSTGQVCSAGTCQESCSEPGRTQCESSCVDLL